MTEVARTIWNHLQLEVAPQPRAPGHVHATGRCHKIAATAPKARASSRATLHSLLLLAFRRPHSTTKATGKSFLCCSYAGVLPRSSADSSAAGRLPRTADRSASSRELLVRQATTTPVRGGAGRHAALRG
jgi:hypothetical protein